MLRRKLLIFGPIIFFICFLINVFLHVKLMQPTDHQKKEIHVSIREAYETYLKLTCSHMLNHSNILNNSNIPIHIKIPRTVSRLSGLFKNYSYTNWKTHAAVNRVLTPCQHMIGMNVVRAFSAFCERYNITYWMIGGSLVGSVRHWDIIPWDKDLDFFVPERDKELLERQFPREQHEVPMYMRPGSLKHGPTKIFPESELKVSWPDNFYPFIDIFYYYENETHLWNHSLCCHHHIRKSVVFPLGIRPLGSLWLPAPQKPFGYFKELDPPLFPRVESECYVRGYAPYTTNMMFEQPMIVKCETLSRVYPFVQRTNNNTERLILDGKVLQTIST